MNLDVLGMGEEYLGHETKLRLYDEWLDAMADDVHTSPVSDGVLGCGCVVCWEGWVVGRGLNRRALTPGPTPGPTPTPYPFTFTTPLILSHPPRSIIGHSRRLDRWL